MVNSYTLVNPYIQGNFKSEIKAQNSHEAANNFYEEISKYFNNSVPEFNFSLIKGKKKHTNKYYHFQVKELRKEDEVSFVINELHVEDNEKLINNFNEKLENFKLKFNQDGGDKKSKKSKKKSKKSKKDDSDSSSESISDILSDFDTENIYRRARRYLPLNQPINYWWYDPYLYRLDSVYMPTFYSYVTPYIELSLSP